jgi:hypothetical protein
MRFIAAICALTLGTGFPAAALEQEALRADVRLTADRVGFDLQERYSNYTLTLTGPQGYVAQAEGARSAPTIRLADHGDVPDGVFTYSLTAATDRLDMSARLVDQRVNGREPGVARPRIGAQMTGQFRVENGRIQIFEQVDEPASNGG